jgi:hypothetical protein
MTIDNGFWPAKWQLPGPPTLASNGQQEAAVNSKQQKYSHVTVSRCDLVRPDSTANFSEGNSPCHLPYFI